MAERRMITVEGNEAVTSVAHRTNEVIAIYPITPSSSMGEYADAWSAQGRKNLWGMVPDVVEMQSEAGAAGAVHGALQAGALTTTFTASQGLLLMIPNMYKIAGELTAYAMHVSARTLATHALSIFGDHSDVMACRQIGFAMLCAGCGQEAHDFALVAQAATLESRVPFLHFFDGFRTSSEVTKVEEMTNDDLRAVLSEDAIAAHRARALTPDRPSIRGTAQNPDTFFQQREACNPFFAACPAKVQEVMDRLAAQVGRSYHLFDYVGHPQAERVIVMMGSGAETADATVQHLIARGERVGLVKVRLYRPFSVERFVGALPATVRRIAVLDRTKESGAIGEPLYLDVMAALGESPLASAPVVVGGRYGLSSKEFTPGMVKAVLDNLSANAPKNHFTVGIDDDVSHTSLPFDASFDVEPAGVVRAVFFGLGADGTVGANKNSIKIIGTETPNFAQGYFVYDSKKSGAGTTSHLRFGPGQIQSNYLIASAGFVACHQFEFVMKLDMLRYAKPGAVFLLNSPYPAEETWDHLPREVQADIIQKNIRFYVIDAYAVARETDMGTRINTIMQTCFFAISGVLPRDEAIGQIKKAIRKTYSKKGEEIVKRNYYAVDHTLAHLHELTVPAQVSSAFSRPPAISPEAPQFVRSVIGTIMAGYGDSLPVSAFSPDGSWPTATTQWEKRNIAQDIPIWEPEICIQCNKCAIVCPHAALRPKIYPEAALVGAPGGFRSAPARGREYAGMRFSLQVAAEDCTGCELCVNTCPTKKKNQPPDEPVRKAINMAPQLPRREAERANYAFFLAIPDMDRGAIDKVTVKTSQLMRPLFEYSGACAGCGETPYVKLVSQLFGDRLLIGNATGCSSIYGGNLPTTPYCVDDNGRGPAWCNSLFEDNAEFTFGLRLAVDANARLAVAMVQRLGERLGMDLVHEAVAHVADRSEAGIAAQRARVTALRGRLQGAQDRDALRLLDVIDYLVPKSVWAFGGDGWAFDIGYGGLDHVVANHRDVNILVMNTEVYSNTGGQASKATPVGASAKFAAAGKDIAKKDLGMMAMNYGSCYVATVALGAKDNQTVQAFLEADSFPGPSLIIAYSHCIAHGFDLSLGNDQQQLAVDSGLWPLFRYDPRRVEQGEPPLRIDSTLEPKVDIMEFMKTEARFKMVQEADPDRFERLVAQARLGVRQKLAIYRHMSGLVLPR